METLWFWLVAAMLTVYVLLDGFDLGVGIIHLLVSRSDIERRQVLAAISPVWDGNEVWLIAAGGTLYFAFPTLYASAFSGFYLPLMIVLWLLILRGISIEFRNHITSPMWVQLWDVVLSLSSVLLAIFFGAALGNVVRGVPLGADGYFFEPLWTSFTVGRDNGILDWYTVLVGLGACAALTQHGALWVAWHTSDPVRSRALRGARLAWRGTVPCVVLITLATFRVQPHVLDSFRDRPYGWILPAVAVAGLAGVWWFLRRSSAWRSAFLSSCAFLVGMLTSAAFGLYPYVLPSSTDASAALTIYNASAGHYGLKVGLVWWTAGMVLTSGYFIFLYREIFGRRGADNRVRT